MEAATCQHKETVTTIPGGEKGECPICGQVRHYDHDKVTVVRLGRIGEGIVLPLSTEKLSLSKEDMNALGAARKARALQIIQLNKKAGATRAEKEEDTVTIVNDLEKPAATELLPPKPKSRKKWRDYYEQNKEHIIADYKSLRLRDFFNKWHLSSAYWTKLKKEWAVAAKGHRNRYTSRKGIGIKSGKQAAATNVKLPPFPEFNESWAASTKEEWLRSYTEIVTQRGAG